MADHSKPTLASKYVDFLDETKGRLEDISRGFDPAHTAPTNVPENTIRWVGASRKWQRWSGTAWADLAGSYAISITGSAARLTTARSIALSGAVEGAATNFDGSEDIDISVTTLEPSSLSGPVSVEKGGTGAETAEQARANLELGEAAKRGVVGGAGDVLAEGAFGLGGNGQSMPMFPSDGDMPPTQFIAGAGASADGWFSGYNAALMVQRNSNHGFVIEASPTSMAFRINQQGTWTPWREFYHSGNPPPAAGVTWNNVASKPATATRWPSWGEVSGKPGSFSPSAHNHSAGNITSGTLNGARMPMGAGGVGTYAFVYQNRVLNWNTTEAGSGLRPGGSQGSSSASPALTGTWRILGKTDSANQATLAVRIS